MAKRASRIVVVENVYHQQHGEQPTGVATRFSRTLGSEEQPYIRKATLGQDWQEIDRGWIEEPGLLVLINESGPPPSVIPSDEETMELAARLIEVAIKAPGEGKGKGEPFLMICRIPRGESLRIMPTDVAAIRIRCASGTARYSLYLFPG